MFSDFVKAFVRKLRDRGANINDRPPSLIESSWEKIASKAIGEKVDYLLVITKEKLDAMHNQMKHFEIASKIVTQHLWSQTVNDVVKKNRHITLENVIMKTNEKLGGTNFMVASSQALEQAVGQQNRGAL
jgi:hypothetical protein